MDLYFNNDTTRAISDSLDAVYPMIFSGHHPRANFFTHDYTGSRVSQSINDTTSTDSLPLHFRDGRPECPDEFSGDQKVARQYQCRHQQS